MITITDEMRVAAMPLIEEIARLEADKARLIDELAESLAVKEVDVMDWEGDKDE